MTRFFGGPGNFEQRYRDAEAETCGELYEQDQDRIERNYLVALLVSVAIIFACICLYWRFA